MQGLVDGTWKLMDVDDSGNERKEKDRRGGGRRVAFDMRCNSCTKTNFDEVTAFLADRKSVQAHSKKGRTWISLYRLPKKTVLSFFQ